MTPLDVIRNCEPSQLSRDELERYIADAVFAHGDVALKDRLLEELKRRDQVTARSVSSR